MTYACQLFALFKRAARLCRVVVPVIHLRLYSGIPELFFSDTTALTLIAKVNNQDVL